MNFVKEEEINKTKEINHATQSEYYILQKALLNLAVWYYCLSL